jgi:hypothetical protein
MTVARWPLRGLLIVVAGLALACAGANKWQRYTRLKAQMAVYEGEEKRFMDAYHETLRIPRPCGNELRTRAAYRAIAAERHRLREDCERELARIW